MLRPGLSVYVASPTVRGRCPLRLSRQLFYRAPAISIIPFLVAVGFIVAVVGPVIGLVHYISRPRLGLVREFRYYDSSGRLWTETATFEERNASGRFIQHISGSFRMLTVTVTGRHLVVRSPLGFGWASPELELTVPVEQVVSLKIDANVVKVRFEPPRQAGRVLALGLTWSSRFVHALESARTARALREAAP